MAKVLVYRLETKSGEGVYHSGEWDKATDLGFSTGNRHPSPHRDEAIAYFSWQHYFGFATLSQYSAWVHKKQWRKNLDRQGIVLNLYSVDKEFYARGDHQCIFEKAEATLVRTMSPSYRDA